MIIQQVTVYEGTSTTVLPEEVQQSVADKRTIVVEKFTIADARRVKELAYQRPQVAPFVDIVIQASVYLPEAQNALLKVLEEPPATTRIHLVVPYADSLLPTVRSRVQVAVATEQDSCDEDTSLVFSTFMASSYKDRLAAIDAAHKQKDNQFFVALFDAAERYVSSQTKQHHELATFVVDCKRLLQSPGASKKMLSEELALRLPYQSS